MSVLLSILTNVGVGQQLLLKFPDIGFHTHRFGTSDSVPCRRIDMTKLIVATGT
jgi:hypothetical protein